MSSKECPEYIIVCMDCLDHDNRVVQLFPVGHLKPRRQRSWIVCPECGSEKFVHGGRHIDPKEVFEQEKLWTKRAKLMRKYLNKEGTPELVASFRVSEIHTHIRLVITKQNPYLRETFRYSVVSLDPLYIRRQSRKYYSYDQCLRDGKAYTEKYYK